MTKRELEQYRSIVAEIDEVRERIKENAVSDTVVGSALHYPFTQHTVRVEGPEDASALRRDKALLACLEKQKQEIEDFVNAIPDSLTRRIFRLRYIKGKQRPSWQKIAFKVSNGVLSGDAVRKMVDRYLEKL